VLEEPLGEFRPLGVLLLLLAGLFLRPSALFLLVGLEPPLGALEGVLLGGRQRPFQLPVEVDGPPGLVERLTEPMPRMVAAAAGGQSRRPPGCGSPSSNMRSVISRGTSNSTAAALYASPRV
jgi:hypothetical protein